MSLRNDSEFYDELFKRNLPIIGPETQNNIKKLRLLVAGCGSTGGAFIEGASRLGVLSYRLVEPDSYDLNNLNRQFVYPDDLGQNKASVHARRLASLLANCGARIETDLQGVTEDNIELILRDVDLVFDAVDVTTGSGMKAKLLLHERACGLGLPVFSALDLGYKQWIRFFDYRSLGEPLQGRLEKARACIHPLKALVEGFCSFEDLSVEISEEVLRLMGNPGSSACQLGAACHLLAAFTGPLLLRFCEAKSIPELISFDLMRYLESPEEQLRAETRRREVLMQLEKVFQNIA